MDLHNELIMVKLICLFVVITMITTIEAKAQDTKRDIQLQQILGLSKKEYKDYSDSIRVYDKRITAVIKDSTLDKNAKSIELGKALLVRGSYVRRHLTTDQQKKLNEYDQQYANISPRIKSQKELEERLKQRGIRFMKDSLNQR